MKSLKNFVVLQLQIWNYFIRLSANVWKTTTATEGLVSWTQMRVIIAKATETCGLRRQDWKAWNSVLYSAQQWWGNLFFKTFTKGTNINKGAQQRFWCLELVFPGSDEWPHVMSLASPWVGAEDYTWKKINIHHLGVELKISFELWVCNTHTLCTCCVQYRATYSV